MASIRLPADGLERGVHAECHGLQAVVASPVHSVFRDPLEFQPANISDHNQTWGTGRSISPPHRPCGRYRPHKGRVVTTPQKSHPKSASKHRIIDWSRPVLRRFQIWRPFRSVFPTRYRVLESEKYQRQFLGVQSGMLRSLTVGRRSVRRLLWRSQGCPTSPTTVRLC